MLDNLDVRFNGYKIVNKQIVDLKDIKNQPFINFKAPANKFYTTIMFDPDAPSRKQDMKNNWLHWLKINNNDIVMPFKPSDPPIGSGPHRYCICLLEQQTQLDIPSPSQRAEFDIRGFINRYKLKPISYVMYIAERKGYEEN